jgi:4-hydroxy-2-oxoheptanedioate aldolase
MDLLSLKMSLTDVHVRTHRMRGSFLAHTLATVPGFNWLLVDAEHGQITDSDIYDVCVLAPIKPVRMDFRAEHFANDVNLLSICQLCNTITNRGISPIVRIPSDESWMIKRALDSGASGIMTPMCHTAVRSESRSHMYKPQY